jgi:hypothetical protein
MLDKVRLLPEGISSTTLGNCVTTPYVLTFPECTPVMLCGVNEAIEILENDQDLDSVGGLMISSNGRVMSGAHRIAHTVEGGKISVVPMEAMEPSWERRGVFASTPVDFLGGVVLARRPTFRWSPRGGLAMVQRALIYPSQVAERTRIIYSGLLLTASIGPDTPYAKDGTAIAFPSETYKEWQKAGIKEVSLLHRGRIIRLDQEKEVVYYPYNRKLAVDGRGSRAPYEPSLYFAGEHHARQLGPGFMMAASWLGSNRKAEGHDFPSRQLEITPLEAALISKIRKIGHAIPTSWVARLRGLLFKILGPH